MAKDVLELVDLAKTIIAENNMTIKELSENIGAEEGLIQIILDPNNDVVPTLSRMVEFLKIDVNKRRKKFKPYKIFQDGTTIKVVRVIKPKCSMYYDTSTGDFFNFLTRDKSLKISDMRRDIYISEMAKAVQKFLE